MSSAIDVRPDQHNVGTKDDTEHLFCCCSRDIGLCGADIAGEPECFDCDHPECESCAAIADAPCILCGLSTSDHCYCGGCY